MKLFYCNGYGDLDFSKLGFNLYDIKLNDYDYIKDIESGDVLFIKLDDIDILNQLVNPKLKITIFLSERKPVAFNLFSQFMCITFLNKYYHL